MDCNEKVFLKKFGARKVNTMLIGHRATKYLWHVFIYGVWKAVPNEDIIVWRHGK